MTTVNKTKPTDVYIAYAGGNPGFGVSVALWSPEHGCCKAISRFIEHGTSNSGCLEAVADVLAYFDGEPVLIHTNHGYITGNLKHLPRWAEGDWQATAGGAPIKNVDQWRRIYEHPGYLREKVCSESKSHPMIVWAKELATLRLDNDLASAEHPVLGHTDLVQTLYPASWDNEVVSG